ncbi:hypothetical protein [Hafnia phage yong3]|nr:hypothetical protein [Hafnia phage yong3]
MTIQYGSDVNDVSMHIPNAGIKGYPQVTANQNKYSKLIRGKDQDGNVASVYVDVYDVLTAWEVQNPALQHLIKKALQPGERGHKNMVEDLKDIIASAKRALELEMAKGHQE